MRRLSVWAWYRFSLQVPAGSESFSLQLPEIYVSYECFVDGKLAVTAGRMSPSVQAFYQTTTIVPLAAAGRTQAGLHTVALRVWRPAALRSAFGGGPGRNSGRDQVFGPTAEIERIRAHDVESSQLLDSAELDLGFLSVVAGLTSLLLFTLRRSEREYLWFGIAVMAPGIPLLVQYWQIGRVVSVTGLDAMLQIKVIVSIVAYLLFYKTLFRARAGWGFKLAVACVLLNPVPLILLEGFSAISPANANWINLSLQLPYQGWIVWLLLRRIGGRTSPMRVCCWCQSPCCISGWILTTPLQTARQAGWQSEFSLESWQITHPFPINPRDIANAVFLLAMFVILLNRFARTRREQEHYEAQFQAAREVQRLLVPETLEIPAGFVADAEYRPAQEVGGDFYQVLPTEDGGLLVVVGDVAGKGMPAAMMVAMIVGVIRTQAVRGPNPALLLQVLNDRMQGRTGGGFSTCIAAWIRSDGRMLLANAGHLPPYRNGRLKLKWRGRCRWG